MHTLKKLRWRCRRGVVELDLLLLRYLEQAYSHADPQEQSLFAELLAWEDDALLATLLGGESAKDPAFSDLIGRIVSLSTGT